MMEITYREAMQLDLPVLVSMERALFADAPWSMGQFKEEFAGIPKTRYFLVALDSDKQIVGYAGVMVVASGVDADVLTVAVLPEARRRGIARHFLDSLEKWSLMRGAPSMILEVGVNNSSAIALYETLDYSIINTRKNYYGPGLDAHVMRKELT
jgi:ribosomal-protein-alanine N-acetyltransferase